jgi:uncharacterized SAM-binding protein YcdF (DUF218 family)
LPSLSCESRPSGPRATSGSADIAVVFGARVWNNGKPSEALADRIDEAVRLYRAAGVARLSMSGGIDPENGLSEAQVMRPRADAGGVPPEAILVDEAGVDAAWTVRNAAAWMRLERLASALIVTHYYHEPRAKMLFERAGVRAYTVPATMTRRLYKEPYASSGRWARSGIHSSSTEGSCVSDGRQTEHLRAAIRG